jgi:hypothetical protein
MRSIPILTVCDIASERLAAIEQELGERRTLAHVLEWARTSSPPRQVATIVTQDEYTHDVVLPLDREIFLVFDTT